MIPLVFSAASLLFCGFFFVYFRRYIRQRTSRENILAECEGAVARLEAQIDAVTDRDVQLVEERIRNLKKLLEDADRRIGLLARIEDQRKPAFPLYNSLGNPARFSGEDGPFPPDTAASPDPVPASVSPVLAASLTPDTVPGATVPAPGLPEARPEASSPGPAYAGVPLKPPSGDPAPEPGEDTRPLVERVAELDRAGFSPELIASRLGVSVSEAELAVTVSRHSHSGSL
jgi:hypothetical protein